MSILNANYSDILDKLNSYEEYQEEIKNITEEFIYQKAISKNEEEFYEEYIKLFPNGKHIDEITKKLEDIKNFNQNISTLIGWADENNIPSDKFPRDKNALKNITILDLSNLNLDIIPQSIGYLTKIEILNLSN
ncbi:MAG: hypothetical protein DSY40_00120, partial [Nautilia sp.]